MCCEKDNKIKKEFLENNKGKKYFFAWKVISEYGRACHFMYYYNPGVNHALLPSGKKKNSKVYNEIRPSGIHVYVNLKDAEKISKYDRSRKLIRVVCYYEDLIAIEHENSLNRQAVLNKVTIFKSDWQKIKVNR